MKTFRKMVRDYASRTGSPFSLSVLRALDEGRFGDILALKASPRYATSAMTYFEDAQLSALFSKRQDLDLDVDPKQACIDNWFSCEQKCAHTNRVIRTAFGAYGPPTSRHHAIAEFICDVRDVLTRWLGPAPKLSDLEPRFGPGSTTSLPSSTATLPDKLSNVPDVTLRLGIEIESYFHETGYGRALTREGYGVSPYRPDLFVVVEHARFTTVKKKASIDRPIEIQADLNVAYQLPVGDILKGLARRLGLDLRKRVPDNHRRLAYEASITGHLATDDLKSASDTICKELVYHGFPADWVDLFCTLRHERALVDGRSILLEKFSGMGNGFTFELETFLILAICWVSLERAGIRPKIGVNLSVFGDDIIIDSSVQTRVVRTLSLLGFSVNMDKSFGAEVAFKESCGEDYFRGKWVRPHFLKKEPHEPQEWISFANGLRRVGINHYGADIWSSTPLYRLYLDALENLPVNIRKLRGPERFGDLVIHEEDETMYETRLRDKRIFLRVWRPVNRRVTTRHGGRFVGWDEFPNSTRLAASLYSLHHNGGANFDETGVLPRGPVDGYKFGWVVLGVSPC